MGEEQNGLSVSNAVLDTHIGYLRRDMTKVLEAVESMATREDIDRLEDRMELFATRVELDTLRAEVQSGSVFHTFERWLSMATRVLAFVAMLGGLASGAYVIFKFIYRVPQ